MAKPNYNFEKRQREIAKKKQQDEKRLKKRAKSEEKDSNGADVDPTALPDSGGGQPPGGHPEPLR